MTKKRTTFITLLVLAGISFFISIASFVSAFRQQLKNASVVTGQVKYAFITERLTGGVKYKMPQTIFCFRLNNSEENFAVYRSNGNYTDLVRDIKPAQDKIKVYYSPGASQFNMDVYQIEKDTQVLYAYETYRKGASNRAGYILIGSMILVAMAFLRYTDFNIFQFLIGLTSTSRKAG